MPRLPTKLLAALTAFAVIGCGGDDGPAGVNSGDALTEAELQAVFGAMAGAFETVGAAPAAAPARATYSANQTFDASAPCESGGTISVNGSASGTVDDVSGEVDVTYHLRLTPSQCTVPTETTSISLDGAPYIQWDMDLFVSETLIEISGTQSGGLSFTADDGRSGSCAFDVDFSGSVDLSAQSGTSSVSGTVCGVSASNLTVFDLQS